MANICTNMICDKVGTRK